MKKTLDIGEVAHSTGLRTSTLRYYEEKGLIRTVGRQGMRRLFDYRVLEQLELIALGQMAGFSLAEIITMFSSDNKNRIDRKRLLSKASDLDKKIKNLIAVKNTLQHVAQCSFPNQMDCPKFKKLLKLAGRNVHKRKITRPDLSAPRTG